MQQLEIIKEAVGQLLEKMDFEGQVSVFDNNQENLLVNIETNEAGFLIGQAGVNLEALQHLARALVNKKTNQPVRFILDVNSYRKHRIDLLKELAIGIAKQASSEKVAVTLQPMSAYDRRIIHLALASYADIKTESIGQEPERRIVIKSIK